MKRCKIRSDAPWLHDHALVADIVMPSRAAALARLRVDDPCWNDATVISEEETNLPQSPPARGRPRSL